MELTDERIDELLIRCQSGQPQKEAAVWNEFSQYVLTVARRIARAQARLIGLTYENCGEDIVMDSWIALQSNIGKINNHAHLRAWLRITVRNRMIDMRRAGPIRFEEPLDALPDVARDDPDTRDHQLYAAIRSLPLPMRACVFEYYWVNRTQGEIAAMSGTPLGTIKTRLYHARSRLARALNR